MTAPQLPCPTCGLLTPLSAALHLPFCSERCRLIDLGRWLDEHHVLPSGPVEDEDDANASGAALAQQDRSSAPDRRANPERWSEPDRWAEPDRAPVRLPPGWHDA